MRHKLSAIEIEKVNGQGGLLGFASFVVDDEFRFQSIAIFSRLEGGIRLSWPEKFRGLKKIKTAAPISTESFIDIESQVFKAMKNNEGSHNAKTDNHRPMPIRRENHS